MPISPVLAWFLIGILFFVIELVLPGFIVFFFGIGAWCAALAVYFSGFSLTSQLAVFIVCSLASLLLLRAYLRGVFLGKSQQEDDSVNVEPASATGVVIEEILPPAEGRVKYGGSFWRAVADEPVVPDTVVRIIEQNNLVVKVQPLVGCGEEE